MNLSRNIAFALGAIILTAACQRKPLLEENLALTLCLDGAARQETLWRCLVYDADKGTRLGYSFVAPEGGEVAVTSGNRLLVAHVFGCETAVLRGEDSADGLTVTTNDADAATCDLWSQLVATAPADLRPALEGAGAIAWQPDAMEVALADRLTVPRRAWEEDYAVTIPVVPAPRTATLLLPRIVGMEYISSAAVFVTGLSRGLLLRSGQPVGGYGVMMAPMYRGDATTLRGSLSSFGECPGQRILAVVTVTDIGAGCHAYISDITDRFDASGTILLDGMDIVIEKPDMPDGGGGFLPVLEDWNTKIVPVDL